MQETSEKRRSDVEMTIYVLRKGRAFKWLGLIMTMGGILECMILAWIYEDAGFLDFMSGLAMAGLAMMFMGWLMEAKLPSYRRQLAELVRTASPTADPASTIVAEKGKHCRFCGRQTAEDSLFCEGCGKRLT
ncbi:MAG: hypothetical protein NT131_06025 [Methanomassiliicoccales archaeon]|nr:hypothetical protein [Methanomassiliicoccales archaeon]